MPARHQQQDGQENGRGVPLSLPGCTSNNNINNSNTISNNNSINNSTNSNNSISEGPDLPEQLNSSSFSSSSSKMASELQSFPAPPR